MELANLYQLMPGKDCGICGHGSCNTFLRHVIFRHEDLNKCAWLDEDQKVTVQEHLRDVNVLTTTVKHLAVFEPCASDDAMVMAEVHLASEEVDYGFLDPTYCAYLPFYFACVRCSEVLGIARIEYEGKEILVSQTGKVVVRRAANEVDALKVCDIISQLVIGAVICPCLCTGIECVSGLCTCTHCDVLNRVSKAEKTDTTARCEADALHILSDMRDNRAAAEDITALQRRAVSALAETVRGLVTLSVGVHLACIEKALTDAAACTEKEKQGELFDIVCDLFNVNTLSKYQKVAAHLSQQNTPLSRELHKIVFHARLIEDIKHRFL